MNQRRNESASLININHIKSEMDYQNHRTSFFRLLKIFPNALSSFSFVVGLIGLAIGPLEGGGSVSHKKSASSPIPPTDPCPSLACKCCFGLRSTCFAYVGWVGLYVSIFVPF